MLFSYQWLKELSGTHRSPAKLAELLITHVFEVEALTPYEHGLADILIGRVLEVAPHPNADRLRVASVDMGKGLVRTIVCGAPNIAPGQKVAVVPPGGKLPDGTVIHEADLRGVHSEGMICSEKELALGEDKGGILVLDSGAPVGHSLANYLELNDTILDIKVLPDRGGDALAYRGMAREIAALEGYEPSYLRQDAKPRPRLVTNPKFTKVAINTENCARYILAQFRGVSLRESPLFIRKRLLVSGIRPVNNIVDLTNYLQLLTGQPMHAFDADTIAPSGILVRQGKTKERLTLLDGTQVTLGREDLVIADGKHALALAGVMGGKRSSITEKTKNVAIEIASFRPAVIRKTRERLKLSTDASYRFERGVDTDRPLEALTELVSLMEKFAGAEYTGARDVIRDKMKPRKINLSLSSVEKLLGTKVTLVEVVQLLALLGLGVKKVANRKELEITVPPRRQDLRDEWDLIEEIGRMRGYGKIEAVAPAIPLMSTPSDASKVFERRLKESLSGSGFDEVMGYSFYGRSMKELTSGSDHLSLANPMNPDQEYLRASLLPGLLRIAEKNIRYTREFSIFEIGSVFEKGKKVPLEKKKVALLEVGERGEKSFFFLKGKVEAFLRELGITATFISMAKTSALYHPTATAAIVVGERVLGTLGLLHPRLGKSFGLRGGIALAEFDRDLLEELSRDILAFSALQRFPLAFRDISLIGPKKVTYAQIYSLLFEAGSPLLVEARLFDVYTEGEEKSYAFHLGFGLSDRTIRALEMDECFDKIVKRAGEKLNFRLRLIPEESVDKNK